jgi:sulfite reductase (NADPH) flavoprotein alpha-component
MALSIWRYSHFLLAIVAGIFILLASVTGIILAFEPISKKTEGYFVQQSKDLSLEDAIHTLQNSHSEVLSISVDENDFVLASLTTNEGESGEFYINPVNGEILGKPQPKDTIFEFATNLHRSLFLKSTGRLIVGIVSFLLLLIAISGFVLVLKRQGGFKKWFSKVVFEKKSQYYHVVLSRLTFIPIVIITITGVILSLDRFSVWPTARLQHENISKEQSLPQKQPKDFEIFNKTTLLEISSLEFPFSPFEDDYFILKTPTEELFINQINGEIISQANVSLLTQIIDRSLFLHTGQGSSIWAIILGVSCIVLIILMITGYKLAYDRIKNSSKFTNSFTAQEAKYILLVGSETGSTYSFAYRFAKAMLDAKQSIYVDALDNYTTYPKAKHLIVFTSTYGEGESPSNSSNFLDKLASISPLSELQYSVVGFGSLLYPDYCQFAIDVEDVLRKHPSFSGSMPLFKINNQSEEAFKAWVSQWNETQQFKIKLKPKIKKIKNLKDFEIIKISNLNVDATFLLKLKPKRKVNFNSGDLLAFYPEDDLVERQYSVAKVDDEILLSIKRHEFGVCSNLLFHQKPKTIVKARLKGNSEFHLPLQTKEVVMISNGTGIAPFLGMIQEQPQTRKHLFWGGRTQDSYLLYKDYIESALDKGSLNTFEMALSRTEKGGRYVQDLLMEKQELLAQVLSCGGVIMICGAIAMQNKVLEILGVLCDSKLQKPLSDFEENNQLKMDCY